MQLSKRIPARMKTVGFRWCKRDYMKMSDGYRAARAGLRRPMDTCYWCGHPFADGEMMAVACPDKGANKVLCQGCADELLSSAT